LKNLTGSVWFRFHKPKAEKTKPNQTQTEKTEPNRFEPVFVLKNRTETGWLPVSGFFLNRFGYFFL